MNKWIYWTITIIPGISINGLVIYEIIKSQKYSLIWVILACVIYAIGWLLLLMETNLFIALYEDLYKWKTVLINNLLSLIYPLTCGALIIVEIAFLIVILSMLPVSSNRENEGE